MGTTISTSLWTQIAGIASLIGGIACAPPLLPPTKDVETTSNHQIIRSEHRIPSNPSTNIFVTRVTPSTHSDGVVVFTHGAGSPASAVWDLPSDYSVMAHLAKLGFDTYSVDVRGFGGSTRPPEMTTSPTSSVAKPAVRAHDVMPDLNAAVEFAQRKSGKTRVDLVGWSWGCVVAGMYATQQPQKIRRLVLYAPVFDRKWPRRHRTQGASRSESRSLHYQWLDPKLEDQTIRHAYVQKLFRFESNPDVLILPNGPYRDIYGPDAPIWTPSLIESPTLIIRGSQDKAALRGASLRLMDALEKAPTRHYLEVADMGHFGFRTYKNPELRSAISGFLTQPIPKD